MAEEIKSPTASITGNMLFYKQPELLNIKEHGKLGITPLAENPFDFLRGTQLVPVTVTEFVHAAMSYPIIFAGEEMTPAIVMGMKADTNIFVTDDGKFQEGAYIPAYIRRYPFAAAKNPEDPDNMMICVDRASSMVTTNATAPFFEGDTLSENTKQAVEFIKSYEAETQGTLNFVKAMKELDLLETQDITIAVPKSGESGLQSQKMGTYMGISEAKMLELTPEKLTELHKNGGLSAMYSHRMSQANWQRLLNMEMLREAKTQQPVGQA